MIEIIAKNFDDAGDRLARYYNMWSPNIVRVPDTTIFRCYNVVKLSPVEKDIDYVKVEQKILDNKF